MNEENWVKIETTEMRKNVKKKTKKKTEEWEKRCWIGNGREEEWKAATREKEGNVKEYWRNCQNSVIGTQRGREKWGRKRNEKGGEKRKGVEILE